jgi:hypothetical protein
LTSGEGSREGDREGGQGEKGEGLEVHDEVWWFVTGDSAAVVKERRESLKKRTASSWKMFTKTGETKRQTLDDSEKLKMQAAQCVLVLIVQTPLSRIVHRETHLIARRVRFMPLNPAHEPLTPTGVGLAAMLPSGSASPGARFALSKYYPRVKPQEFPLEMFHVAVQWSLRSRGQREG